MGEGVKARHVRVVVCAGKGRRNPTESHKATYYSKWSCAEGFQLGVCGSAEGLQKGDLPPESPLRLALVDDWEAVVCGRTKPRTRTSTEEGERLGPLAVQVREGAKPGSPEQGVVFLGSCVDEERVVVKVSTLWRGLFCAAVSFSPVTNAAVC